MAGVKDWLEPMLKEYGSQKRRVISGMRQFADGARHEDGWSSRSAAAMALDGAITGGSGAPVQRFDEVYTGEALAVWRALHGAPLEINEIIFEHFVSAGCAMQKAERLGLSYRVYWTRLECAYFYLAGRLDRPSVGTLSSASARYRG